MPFLYFLLLSVCKLFRAGARPAGSLEIRTSHSYALSTADSGNQGYHVTSGVQRACRGLCSAGQGNCPGTLYLDPTGLPTIGAPHPPAPYPRGGAGGRDGGRGEESLESDSLQDSAGE